MAAPATPVDVVNLALLEIYQKPIASLTDTSNKAAIAANAIYDQTRRKMLRNFIFPFAKKRGSAPLVNNPATGDPLAPPFDYLNYYQLPTDMLRLLWVGFDWRRYDPIAYDINGSMLLLNPIDVDNAISTTPWNSVNLLYITDFTNVAQMDALFVELLKYELAYSLLGPIAGGDKTLRLITEEKRKSTQAEAVAIAHQEKPVIVTDIDRVSYARIVAVEPFDVPINPNAWGDEC